MTALRAEGCGRLSAAGCVRWRSGGDSPNGLRVVVAASPQFLKSALRDWLSVSYGIISILVISRYAAPPYPAAPDFLHGKACHTILRSLCFLTNRVPLPPHPGDRINRSMLPCRDMAPWLSTHSAPACGGKVVAPATKGGSPSPARRLYGFRRQRRHKKWRPKAPYLASAAILYNSRGRSPQPACKAKPITGRTLAAQGRKARRLAQPSHP